METVIRPSAIDALPQVASSTPGIAYGPVARAFVVALGSAALLGILPAHETRTPIAVEAAPSNPVAKHDTTILRQLSRKWVDPEAIEVGDATIQYADKLLAELPLSAEFPHLSTSADGEVGFSWTKGGNRFEAILDPDDHLAWGSNIEGAFAPGGDILISSAASRDVFYAALRNFYERA